MRKNFAASSARSRNLPKVIPYDHEIARCYGRIIETPNVLENQIRLSDSEFPHRRRRPSGVLGCEIVGFVGDIAPTDMTSSIRWEWRSA